MIKKITERLMLIVIMLGALALGIGAALADEEVPYPVYGEAYDANLFDTSTIEYIDSQTTAIIWEKADGNWSSDSPEGVTLYLDGRVVYDGSTDAGTYLFRITNGEDEGSQDYAYREYALIIEKADCTVEKAPSGNGKIQYSGYPEKLISEGTVTGGTVYYKLEYDWSDFIPEATEIGNYTVYYYIKADNNHNDLGSSEEPYGTIDDISIEKRTVTAPIASETEFTYNGEEQTYDIIIPDGVKLAEDSDILTHTDAGTYIIKLALDDEEHTQWNEDAVTEYSFVIAKKEISVEWSDTVLAYDGMPKKPTATITNKEKDDDVNALINTTFTDAGNEYIISVDELTGNDADNYIIPETVPSTTFEITPAEITSATVKENSTVYTGDPFTPEINEVKSGDMILSDGDYELSGDITATDKGDYTLVISGKGNYSGSIDIEWHITGKIISANAEDVTGKYNGGSFSIKVIVSDPESGYEIKYSLDRILYSSEIPQLTDAGEYTVYYEVTASNYETFTGSANVKIAKAKLTVSAVDKKITYGAAPSANGVTFVGFADGEDNTSLSGTLDYKYTYSQYGNAGNYKIMPYGLTSDNYDIEFAAGTLTVTPKPVSFEWQVGKYVYTGKAQMPTVTIKGIVNGDVCKATLLSDGNGAGEHTVKVTALNNANYSIGTNSSKKFTIEKQKLSVTAKDASIVFGEAAVSNGATYSGFVNGETEKVLSGKLAFNYNYAPGNNVGNYMITPKGLKSDNYNIVYVAGTLTVTAKTLEFEWAGSSFAYDGTEHAPSLTVTGSVDADTADIISVNTARNVGKYTAAATLKSSNYALPENSTFDFEIIPISLIVKAGDNTITYGDAPSASKIICIGFVGDDTEDSLSGRLDFDYNYVPYDDIGTYKIIPKGLESENYNIMFENGTLTVLPKTVNIVWGSTEFIYDGKGHIPTAILTGIVNNDVCNMSFAGAASEAGGHIAAVTTLSNSNYELPEINTVNYVIKRAPLFVTAKPSTIVFGEEPEGNGVEFVGFVNGETSEDLSGMLYYEFSYKRYGKVGEYQVTPCGISSDNYEIIVFPNMLTVVKAPVTIRLDDQISIEGEPLSKLTFTVESGKLYNKDADGVIIKKTGSDAPGRYTITATFANGNYDATIIDGIYIVKQKNILTNETEITVVSNKGEDPRAKIIVEKLDIVRFVKVDLFDVAGDNAEIKAAYDISMDIDGQKVQPESRLTVTIPIPENLRTDIALKVVCIDENGKAINMNAKRGVNEIEFTTDRLSTFAVVGTKNYTPIMILAIGGGALLTAGVGVAAGRLSKAKKTKKEK